VCKREKTRNHGMVSSGSTTRSIASPTRQKFRRRSAKGGGGKKGRGGNQNYARLDFAGGQDKKGQ